MENDGFAHPLFADPIEDRGQPEDVGLTQSGDDPVLGPDWAPVQDGTEPEDQSQPRFLIAAEARHLADLMDAMDQTRGSFEVHATVLDEDNQVLGVIQEHEDMGYVFMIGVQ